MEFMCLKLMKTYIYFHDLKENLASLFLNDISRIIITQNKCNITKTFNTHFSPPPSSQKLSVFENSYKNLMSKTVPT